MHFLQDKIWHLAHGKSLALGKKSKIMAIINVTPDSFSDGGQLQSLDQAYAYCMQAIEDGADILDIGGESTKPGALPVSAEEEQARILPLIAKLKAHDHVLMSVDTYRASTAEAALAAGAHIINDVEGLQKEPEIAKVAAKYAAGVCIMHTGRGRTVLPDVIEDQLAFFAQSLTIARQAGLEEDRIVLDPGFGFAKESAAINMALMARLEALLPLGFPLLIGTSRKRFLGEVIGRENAPPPAPAARDTATAASSVLARLKGGAIFRVHNVALNREALSIADAMLAAS